MAERELARYRALDELHSRMLDAANQQQWETLITLQEEASQLAKQLAEAPAAQLNAPQRATKADLIRRILDKQTQIAAEVKDWQADVAPMLEAWSG